MLNQRTKGCFWTFGALLLVANTGLFVLYILVDEKLALFGQTENTYPYLYILSIPTAYTFCIPALRKIFEQLHVPSKWSSTAASTRFVIMQAGIFAVIYFLLKDVHVSRLFLVSYLPISLLANWPFIYHGPLAISRFYYGNQDDLRAILYGQGEFPKDLKTYIHRIQSIGISSTGYYADEKLDLPGLERLGSSKEILNPEGDFTNLRADLIIAYTDNLRDSAFNEVIDRFVNAGARAQIYSNYSNAFLDPVRLVNDGSLYFLTFFDEPLQNPINQFLKRSIDLIFSLIIVLLILPPLTILVWFLQRSQSKGPILFRQTRYGLNRRPFTILKYRTMHIHETSVEGKQATKEDPRIFPAGRFLRKTSLDEFPQFINVLRGEMSMVGPRPHLTLHDDEFEGHFRRYRSRHFVRPGITGLAQVSGFRGEAKERSDIIRRVQNDIKYITQWSLINDLYIFLKTIWQILFPPKSAY